ncbi:MAG: hypothetical protein DMG12_05330 [Acidobacteria bacterium]|nr:MAG: hypothetical protein DMG12_05330 [Acidobacteriota bacterium]
MIPLIVLLPTPPEDITTAPCERNFGFQRKGLWVSVVGQILQGMFHKPVLLFITNFSHGPVSGFGESFRFVGKFPPMQVDRI